MGNVLHRYTSVRQAVKAQSLGVDGISIDGFECAGHPGEDDIPGLVLIPAAAEKIDIPMIASGGFADERGTELIFRPLRDTARVASNTVSREVVEILNGGGQFDAVKELLSGVRGRKVFDDGDLDAGIWSVSTAMGLINDIPTVEQLVSRIVNEAEELISGRLEEMIQPAAEEKVSA